MQIENLQSIGKRLLQEMATVRDLTDMRVSVGIGAAGDKTFPVDKIAEEIIFSGLEALKEPLTIISEEAGIFNIHGGGIHVLIDPIDGSKNAIAGIPFFCTSIAVADGNTIGNIKISYIINLANGDEFWAESGNGAWLNGKKICSQRDTDLYMVAYEAPVPSRDIPKIMPLLSKARKARCFGATALDLAYLACGAISVFLTATNSRSFDFAGGWLLVKEAGGVITDITGQDISNIPLGLEKSSTILAAANKELHKKTLDSLRKK